MRVALFTLEALANARSMRRFVADHAGELVLVGLSDPHRPAMGGTLGQIRRHLRRSGWRMLPFLFVNYSLPGLLRALRRQLPRPLRPEQMPLADHCAALGIPAVLVSDVNDPALQQRLASLNLDVIISAHFDQIFRPETLEAARLGGINVHLSALPMHRGPMPTFYALLEQPPLFGISIHRTVAQIDAGEILAQARVDLPPGMTALGAAAALNEVARELLQELLPRLEHGAPVTVPAAQLPYCPFPSKRQLRDAARAGARLADWRDVRDAIRLML